LGVLHGPLSAQVPRVPGHADQQEQVGQRAWRDEIVGHAAIAPSADLSRPRRAGLPLHPPRGSRTRCRQRERCTPPAAAAPAHTMHSSIALSKSRCFSLRVHAEYVVTKRMCAYVCIGSGGCVCFFVCAQGMAGGWTLARTGHLLHDVVVLEGRGDECAGHKRALHPQRPYDLVPRENRWQQQ
jgi:hypothetical protein